jgi:uncharacterized radical SAM superfamily Fe-S cluster-containing enzyme
MADYSEILHTTESLCPVCLKTIPAEVVERDGMVFLEKTCLQHGDQRARIWPDAHHYRWFQGFSFSAQKPVVQVESSAGCPLDCGLCAIHVKHPTVAEIEVTLRCNLRCPVCFMAAGNAPADPSLETIADMFAVLHRNSGPQTAVQLTGGEPTIRKDLPEILRLGRQAGFSAIEVNTNGIMIGRDPAYIQTLAEAGISGIYLQFDGLTRQVYEHIRGADLLDDKLMAVEHCRQAGVQVVLAMTVIRGINDDQLGNVLNFALQNEDVIAGVAYQPVFTSGRFDVSMDHSLTMVDVVFMLAEQSGGLIEPYDLWPLGCSHPLCSCGTYIVRNGGELFPLSRVLTPQEYTQSFDTESPQGSVFADIAARRFLNLSPGLSVVVMNYMDATTVDLGRLKECSMVEVMQDGRLIPFCAYQLSDRDGKRLYPALGRNDSLPRSEKAHA